MSKKPIQLDEKDINFSLISSPSHPSPNGHASPPTEETTTRSSSSPSHGATLNPSPHPSSHSHRGGVPVRVAAAAAAAPSPHLSVPAMLRDLAAGGDGSGTMLSSTGAFFQGASAAPSALDASLTRSLAFKARGLGRGGKVYDRRRTLFIDAKNAVETAVPTTSSPSLDAAGRGKRKREDTTRDGILHMEEKGGQEGEAKGEAVHPTTRILQGATAEEASAWIASSVQPRSLLERRADFEAHAAAFSMRSTTTAPPPGDSGTPERSDPHEGRKNTKSTKKKEENESETRVDDGALSLLETFWAKGIPDVEPWDRWVLTAPRYDRTALLLSPASLQYMRETMPSSTAPPQPPTTATASKMVFTPPTRSAVAKAGLHLLHSPSIPESHYTQYYAPRSSGKAGTVPPSPPPPSAVPKTKEERRAEKKAKAKVKQLEEKKRREAGEKVEDRLSHRNLLVNMLGSSVLNPLSAETKVMSQYEKRFLEHQRRNFERHMEALPHQILKREHDTKRHAEERPVLRCYRIYPIFTATHLGKLRHFANDQRLRGCIVWTAEMEAVVVLVGGEVAARHLDHWMLQKMIWEHEDTTAERICSVPLNHFQELSFHAHFTAPGLDGKETTGGEKQRKRHREGGDATAEEEDDPLLAAYEREEEKTRREEGREHVFIRFSPSVEETLRFFSEKQPSGYAGAVGNPHPSPWGSFIGLWRAACLKTYLKWK